MALSDGRWGVFTMVSDMGSVVIDMDRIMGFSPAYMKIGKVPGNIPVTCFYMHGGKEIAVNEQFEDVVRNYFPHLMDQLEISEPTDEELERSTWRYQKNCRGIKVHFHSGHLFPKDGGACIFCREAVPTDITSTDPDKPDT
jgi:hypothetical protein